MNDFSLPDHNYLGTKFAGMGDYERAINEFSLALVLKPDAPIIFYNRALAYRGLKNYQRALLDFEHALQLNSVYTPAYYQRGLTYFAMQEYWQAIRDFSSVLALKPDDVPALIGRAQVFCARHKYHQAILNLNTAITYSSVQAGLQGAFNHRGQAFVALKNYADAIADFQQALQLQPEDVILLNRLGATYTDSEQPELALEYYHRALALRPDVAFIYNNRGEAYRLMGLNFEAIADFNQAIKLDPSLATAYYNRGLTYLECEEWILALSDFTHALSFNPALTIVYHDRAETYRRLRRYIDAIADYNSILAEDKDDIIILFQRGSVYLRMGEALKAIQDFDRVIEMRPDFACAYTNRGEAYLRLRNIKQARIDCQLSWNLDTHHVEHGWMAQWVELCLHEPTSDLPHVLNTIAAVNPIDYAAYLCRTVAHLLQHEYEQALVEVDKALEIDNEQWGAYFWRAMICAYSCNDRVVPDMLARALALKMPPLLLAPLRWLKNVRPDFYQSYIAYILQRRSV